MLLATGKGRGTGTPGAKKKPAGASRVLKKPACKAKASSMKKVCPNATKKRKPIDMKNVFKELRRVGTTIARNRFTSRAYHAAATLMKQQPGKSETQVKKYAREMFAKASKLYDTLKD